MIDQVQLYDQAISTWVVNTLPPELEGRSTQVLISTSRKMYAEVTTARLVDNETLTLPRIAITKLDPINDPTRFNSNRIRRLGWCNSPVNHALRSARYPAPTSFTYQIDLWTLKVTEMNRWMQKLMFEFAPQYIYLQIRPDDVWQDKMFAVFLEGGISDNSDLEPMEGERAIRRTFTLRLDGWIFDQAFIDVGVVKSFEFQWFDLDTSVLYDTTFLPPKEVVDQGTGAKATFNFTVPRPPVLEHTVILQTMISSTLEHVQDDGAGNLVGTRVSSGTINYATGDVSITYTVAPDNGADLTVSYFTDLD